MKYNFKMDKELIFFPSWAAGRAGYSARILEVFRQHVQKKGLVYTHQREEILNHLLAADRHLTQEEIYGAVRARGIGKVTVFRTLKLLEEAGLTEKVYGPDGGVWYEVKLDRPHHDHLVCLACGAIQEVQWPEIERFQEKACRELKFEPVYHRHEVFGRCRSCVEKG
jgi:Fur family ferric uptake transcriptional regulator